MTKPPATALGARSRQTPFVGREKELDRLCKAFDEAFDGRGGLVMLVGEPGIGKTRTTEELEIYARKHGATVLWGRAHESSGAPPYWPWIQAGNEWEAMAGAANVELSPAVVSELSRVFPVLRQQPAFVEPHAESDPEVAQFCLFNAYATFIRAIAERAPLVIALDDLHSADKPTLLLLQHIARGLSRSRILVVGNYRDTDITRQSPLSESLAVLKRECNFERIVLRGLSREDVGSYVREKANIAPRRDLLDRIFQETEGNAFFLTEIVNLMAEEGTLAEESVSVMAIPDGIKEALGRRLNRLSEEVNDLLRAATVVGREFSYDTLIAMGDRDENKLLELIEEALGARVIEELPQPGRYRFAHALMRETLLGELTTTRRVRLHGQVGEALERHWGARADERASRLAEHFVEAAMLSPQFAQKAVHYAKLAAVQAESQAAWDDAANWYERVVSVLNGSEDGLGEDEAQLLVAAGRCFRYDVQHRAAWRCLMRATTLYHARGDGEGMARAALEAEDIYGPRDRLAALAAGALDVLGDSDPSLRARLLLMHAAEEWDAAHKEEEEEAGAIAQALDDPALLGRLVTRHAAEALHDLRVGDAVARSRHAHALFDKAEDHGRAAERLFHAADWTLWAGALDTGTTMVREALAYARAFHVGFAELECLGLLQAAALVRSDFEQFESILSEVVGDLFWFPMFCAARAEMSGDTDGALKLVPGPDAPGGVAPILRAQLLGSLARVNYNAGHHENAREGLLEWYRELNKLSALSGGRGDFLSAVAELDECLPALGDESMIVPVYEELVALQVWRYCPWDGRGLDRIRGALALKLVRIDEAEDWYRMGLEWAERERCPVEAGRCLHGLSNVAVGRHRRREALRLLDAASALFEEHGAKLYLDRAIASRDALFASAHGPTIPLPEANPDGLTAREVEVLRLVAGGASSREVGEKLVLSVRTVERHIANVYLKTATHNRAQMTAYALTHGLGSPGR